VEDTILQLGLRVAPFLVMGVIMVLNQFAAARRGDRKERRDSTRLRAALHAELQALRALYEENLRLLADQEGYLLSVRPLLAIYRANLTRIGALQEHEIATMVAVNSTAERLEALCAVYCKPSGNLAWRIGCEDMQLATLLTAMVDGAANVEDALEVLTPLVLFHEPISPRSAFRIVTAASVEA
jgi:hypothetical protein